MGRRFVVLGLLLAGLSPRIAHADPSARLKRHVAKLASPRMAGRRVGTDGHDLARDYIVRQFRKMGLEPTGDDGFLSPFDAVWRAKPDPNMSLELGSHVLALGVGYRPCGITGAADLSGRPIFVGYGLSAPGVDYDDYAGVDVRGRVVVALTGVPKTREQAFEPVGRRYLSTAESKAAVALSKGASAILLVNDPRHHGDLPEQRPDVLHRSRFASALTGIGVARLTNAAASAALSDAGIDLAGLQRGIDASGAPASRELDVEVSGRLVLDREVATVANVVARLPHRDGDGPPIIVGAHYDHLGYGAPGSLYEGGRALHPGADDNASGVAVLIEAARTLRSHPPPGDRPVWFVATTAEELALRGSRHLAAQLAARGGTYVNMDMVGRLREPGLRVLGTTRHPELAKPVAAAARKTGIAVVDGDLYDAPSDQISFEEARFDVLHLTTGRHADYHMPTDTVDRVDVAGMNRVRKFVVALVSSCCRSRR